MSLDIFSIIPEIIVVCTGIIVVMLSVFIGKGFDKAAAPLSAAGLIISGAAVIFYNWNSLNSSFNGSFLVDNFSIFFRLFTLVTALLIIGLAPNYIK
jgi:NADH:ubiquinone oxidoreductase subunit 2 (subunit N)